MDYRFGNLDRKELGAVRITVLVVGVLLFSLPVRGVLQDVADRFGAADYDGARSVLEAEAGSSRAAEDLLWRSRLLVQPDKALELLEQAIAKGNLPKAVQIRITMEIAELESARGRHEEALKALNHIFLEEEIDLPGAFYLQAGLTYRALGKLQKAREMLASIRPEDPVFAQGRGTLGEIGLWQNDPTLALHYFQSVPSDGPAGVEPVLAAGLWNALRRTGEHAEADKLVNQLRDRHPGCLALLEINRVLRTEKEELAARAVDIAAPADSVINRTEDRLGRYCLQLGAFSDRGLALEFQQRFLSQVPGLHIEQLRDQRGQFLYKVRTGSFVNPARASTEATRLKRLLGVDVIVTDQAN